MKVIELLKLCFIFVLNLLIFMFFRRTLKEHFSLLVIVLAVSGVLGLLIGIPLFFGFVSLDSELFPLVDWIFDFVLSFLDIEKLSYIGITYLIALFVYLLSDFIIELQNKRDLIPLEVLRKELKVNSRAVLIVMSGALSLTFKLLNGMLLILFIVAMCAGLEAREHINMTHSEFMTAALSFLWFDIALFIIGKFLVSPFELFLGSRTESETSGVKGKQV